MLFFYFYYRQPFDRLFLRPFSSLSPLSFFFAETADLFKDVIRSKVLIEIAHEIIGVELAAVLHLHAKKLSSIENIHEVA